jgi:phospholipid/cholesterol/gamma-HCH transport system substrate-binding protein
VRATRAAGVGAFVLVGLALFTVVLFLIGDRRGLFSNSFTVYSEMRMLSGVEVGLPVWVSGMSAGEVKGIEVPSKPGRPFRVRMRVDEALHPIVRVDSVVSVRAEGLVGGRYLQISAGTESAPRLPEGGTLASQEPFDVAEMLAQIRAAVDNFNTTILALRSQFDQAIDSVEGAAEEASTLLRGASDDMNRITTAGRRIVENAGAISDRVRAGEGSLGRLVTDDQLYRDVAAVASEARQTAENIRAFSQHARGTMETIESRARDASPLGGALQGTLDQTQAAMANLADATEALKHNFLLRGYFRNRGYFSLADLGESDYREGILERDGRRALRIWLSASVLFETGPDGREVIGEGGRGRLDSALGQFLQHREGGPIIVEGYATAPDEAGRYLLSRARAAAVRDYLIGQFDLDPSAVGFLGLGHRPVGDPPADPWDGIALAVFVRQP